MPVVIIDGGKPQVQKVVVVVQGAQLKQGDDGAVVVVTIFLFILKSIFGENVR